MSLNTFHKEIDNKNAIEQEISSPGTLTATGLIGTISSLEIDRNLS